MENTKNYVVGVDIGGQTAKIGVIDRRGNVVAETVIPSNKHTDDHEFVAFLAEAIKALIAKAGVEGEVVGVGAGAPCANFLKGTMDNAANVTWAAGRIVPFGIVGAAHFGRHLVMRETVVGQRVATSAGMAQFEYQISV